MAVGRCTTIPKSFSFILPVQSLITGVVVYGVVFAYTIKSIIFILAVAATGLQFFLGLYCCFLGAKIGIYHRYIIPAWLVALAGVWAATIYYVTVGLDDELKLKSSLGAGYSLLPGRSDGDAHVIWRAVAVGGSAVNCFIDLILLAIFILVGVRRANPVGFDPNPLPAPSSHPTFAPTSAAPTFYQTQPPHQSASTFGVASSVQAQQQQQKQVYGQPSPLGSNPSMGTVPLYHQQQQQYTASQAATHIGTSPSPRLSAGGKSPATATVSTAVDTPITMPYSVGSFDPQNRIEILSRLVSLQMPDGHWDYSAQLQEIMGLCGRQMTDASPANVTSMACALAVDICQYVWASQRDGREYEALSHTEITTLQGLRWDLSWAQRCTENATAWLSKFR